MSSNFFFLLSSLPRLAAGEKPLFDYDGFLARCEGHLTTDEAEVLRRLSLSPDQPAGQSAVLDAWLDWERDMRNGMADYRSRRMQRQPGEWNRETRTVHPFDRRHLDELMAAGSGREREEALAAFRLQALETLAGGHVFDFEALVAYALRLLILLRLQAMSPEPGAEKFRELALRTKEQAWQMRAAENQHSIAE